jgi:hypothetical protein
MLIVDPLQTAATMTKAHFRNVILYVQCGKV